MDLVDLTDVGHWKRSVAISTDAYFDAPERFMGLARWIKRNRSVRIALLLDTVRRFRSTTDASDWSQRFADRS